MKEPFDKLWNTAVRFQEKYDAWTKGPILGLNAEEVAEEVRYQFSHPAFKLSWSD